MEDSNDEPLPQDGNVDASAEEDVGDQRTEVIQEAMKAGMSSGLPRMVASSASDESDDPAGGEGARRLRHFHLGDPAVTVGEAEVAEAHLPALLYPYRNLDQIRYDYPLFLSAPSDAERLAYPLDDFIAEAIDAFAPGADSARILKDNSPWLERHLRDKLSTKLMPVGARGLLEEAGEALVAHLAMEPANEERLRADLAQLADASGDGQLLGYCPQAALHLLVHTIHAKVGGRRRQFGAEIEERTKRLESLLAVERGKAGADDETVKSSVGTGARYFDESALSDVLVKKPRGSIVMSDDRKQRIEKALATLDAFDADDVIVSFVGKMDDLAFRNLQGFAVVDDDDPCGRAGQVFDEEAGKFAKLFAAVRIADLEIEDRYQADVHDSWFSGFGWQAFSREELDLINPVVAVDSASNIAQKGLLSLAQLLGSGKPVTTVVWVSGQANPVLADGGLSLDASRFELGYFGIGFRQAVVSQVSAARYEQLLGAFVDGIDSVRTSLHLVNTGFDDRTSDDMLDPWLLAGAALESRAHPYLLVNPSYENDVQQRKQFDGNPCPEEDWSGNELAFVDGDGKQASLEIGFTPADYALLFPELRGHFMQVDSTAAFDDLIPLCEYLALDAAEADRKVPYILAVSRTNQLVKLVVSRALTLSCMDRRHYWRTLQELVGVRNHYVELAKQQVLANEQARSQAELEELRAQHAEELAKVRAEAGGEAMGKLAEVLLGLDLAGLESGAAVAPVAVPEADEAVDEAEAGADEAAVSEADVEEDTAEVSGPWIETILCTSCNDCMAINQQLFLYDENKQAYIQDPTVGTFAEIVNAAEICPARCIHPGSPLDPEEPGLEELIERAEPYN